MNKTLKTVITFICLLLTVSVNISCKKSTSRHDQLVGSWQDDYSNRVEFDGNGKGYLEFVNPAYGRYDFTWVLQNDKDIVLSYGNNQYETWTIIMLTGNRLDYQEGTTTVELTRM